MKKGTIALLVVGVFILALVMGTLTTYNGLVSKDEAVATAWGNNVQSQYQRRADLVPNLVSTVKGYAKHEKETLNAVIEARNKFKSANTPEEEMKASGENSCSSPNFIFEFGVRVMMYNYFLTRPNWR